MSSDDPTIKLPSEGLEQLRELTAPMYAFEKPLQQFEKQVAAIPKIEEQVSALDQKVDQRLHETRPIWEGVLAELRDFRAQTETEVEGIRQRIDTFVVELFEVRVRQRDFETRLRVLEQHPQVSDETPE
ncbi:MAG TPA: hypothetical protein VFB82_06035 [Blastocatellia bacterium]|nr:hypothetical protein [Blastocatellia bacterium]